MILAVTYFAGFLNVVIGLTSLFLVLLILIQRGKGGGLAGAFGGQGGSSAFGSKAGDAFTRVTLIAAAIWVGLIMVQTRVIANAGKDADQQSITAPNAE